MRRLSELLEDARKALAPSGASHEARLLARRAFLMTDAQFLLHAGDWAEDEKAETFLSMVNERLSGRPLQYILGEWDFLGLRLKVREGTLIPRFDTETAAQRAIRAVHETGAESVLDLCCGGGCIAVAVAANTKAAVTASEVSAAALALTRENAELNGVSDRVETIRSNMLESVEGRFGVIVSNPPYIPSGEIAGLDAEVKDYEPRLALDGGPDGLAFYRTIAIDAPKHLADHGALILEAGDGQASPVAALLASAGFGHIEIIRDLSGKERVVTGTYSEDR